jgi:nicotinamidase-related amidase
MRRWEEIFTGADLELLKKAGMAQKQPFGSQPALLLIDITIEFIGSKPQPVLESADEYGTSCGEAGWASLPGIQKLSDACRDKGIPVIYTNQDTASRRFTTGAVKMALPEADYDLRANEIPESIKPESSDLVISKTRASGFFGTPLLSCLRTMGIDCLLVAGCTTSGCVRATVVDAFSYGYRCFVVEECVFDRFDLSHLVNLFDMNAKYADVITMDEALGYISELRY